MARVYVGNLPLDIRTRDIEDLFWKYGRIRDIDLKTPSRPPAFAFVSFENFNDAEDAIRGRDGVQFEGSRLRCELSRGSADQRGGGYGDRGGGGYDDRGGRYGDRGGGGRGEPPRGGGGRAPPRDLRRSDYRVIVSNLPSSASWQDLKDHFRQAGDVIYTDVDRKGGGIVEFAAKADQEAAINKLDDTEFKNPFDKVYIRVKYPREQGGHGKAGSRSRSRSRSRSGSRDRRDRRERSKGRSSSRSRSRSRSGGRRGREDRDDDDRKEDKEDKEEKKDEDKEEKMEDKEDKEEKKDEEKKDGDE